MNDQYEDGTGNCIGLFQNLAYGKQISVNPIIPWEQIISNSRPKHTFSPVTSESAAQGRITWNSGKLLAGVCNAHLLIVDL